MNTKLNRRFGDSGVGEKSSVRKKHLRYSALWCDSVNADENVDNPPLYSTQIIFGPLNTWKWNSKIFL